MEVIYAHVVISGEVMTMLVRPCGCIDSQIEVQCFAFRNKSGSYTILRERDDVPGVFVSVLAERVVVK